MLHRRCLRSVGGKRRDRAHNQGEYPFSLAAVKRAAPRFPPAR